MTTGAAVDAIAASSRGTAVVEPEDLWQGLHAKFDQPSDELGANGQTLLPLTLRREDQLHP